MFGEPRPPFRHVLTAIDGSTHAEFAFEAAVRLAQRDNARLTLLVVAPDLMTDARFAWATVNPAALQEDAEKAVEKLLQEAAAAVPENVPVTKRSGAAIRARRSWPRRTRRVTTWWCSARAGSAGWSE